MAPSHHVFLYSCNHQFAKLVGNIIPCSGLAWWHMVKGVRDGQEVRDSGLHPAYFLLQASDKLWVDSISFHCSSTLVPLTLHAFCVLGHSKIISLWQCLWVRWVVGILASEESTSSLPNPGCWTKIAALAFPSLPSFRLIFFKCIDSYQIDRKWSSPRYPFKLIATGTNSQ